MEKVLLKFGFGEKLRKYFRHFNYFCWRSYCYGLPYFRYDYYDAYLQVYHLTNTQVECLEVFLGYLE